MTKKISALLLLLSSTLTVSNAIASENNQELVNKGRAEYEARCMHCHGENADGKGHLISFLKIAPADLTVLNKTNGGNYVTDKILKAVLGRHKAGEDKKMPLLKDVLSIEKVYLISEYIKSVQK